MMTMTVDWLLAWHGMAGLDWELPFTVMANISFLFFSFFVIWIVPLIEQMSRPEK